MASSNTSSFLSGTSGTSLLSTFLLLLIPLVIFLIHHLFRATVQFPANAPPLTKRRVPFLGSTEFMSKKWDFYREAMKESATGNFSFYLGNHSVVGLAGDEARKLYFDSRDLDFDQGYDILFPSSPPVEAADKNESYEVQRAKFAIYARRTLINVIKERLEGSMPQLIQDTIDGYRALPLDGNNQGITQPFHSLYRIVWKLTNRLMTCDDVTDSPVLLEKSIVYMDKVANTISIATVFYPWLPTLSKIRRFYYGFRLFMMFFSIANARKKSGERKDDSMQTLLDQGDDVSKFTQYMLGVLFAAQLNSGTMSAWLVVYLAGDQELLRRAREEVLSVVRKRKSEAETSTTEDCLNVLKTLSLKDWEEEFPFLDLCVKEITRKELGGTFFRKNTSGKEIKVGNEVIPAGAFVAYSTKEVHFNPEIYTNPNKFDPDRYQPGRAEDKKRPYAMVGWGAGRHMCIGIRFAKIELKLMMAVAVIMYDWDLCDKKGNPQKEAPSTFLNAYSTEGPEHPQFIKYSRRA